MQEGTSQNLQEEQTQSLGVGILPGEVEAELQRILASPTFRKAPRHCRFLSFVVWKALAGEAETVKEYLIGLEVFDRPSDYDPGTDPIVRAEARRLRSRLVDYYQTLGKLDQVRIDLPKGTYVPVFYRNGVEPPLEEAASDLDSVAPIAKQRDEVTVRPARKTWRRWLAAAAVVIVAAIVAGYFVSRRPAKFTDKDTVVLADFANSTGDPVFDDTLKTALSVALNQSPFLNVLSDNKVAATLQLMARPASTVLTPEVTRELCQRADGKAYIAGSIAAMGNNYVLGLKAVNCQNGDLLAQEQVTATAKERVLDSLGEAATRLRGQLGESLATVQKFDVPLEQATTSSLEALKAYSLAAKATNEKGAAAGLPHDLDAIQLDPNFAMGYRSVGLDYYSRGELGRASEYFTKAFELRKHASEREGLTISADYYSTVTGELDKVIQTYERLIESYPHNAGFLNSLGTVYATQGQYEKATEVMRQTQHLVPDFVAPYEDLGNFLLALQRFDEARQVIHEAQARKLDDVSLHNALYALAFLGADSPAMAEQQQWFAGKPEYENFRLALASDTEAYAGHLGKARDLTKRSVNSAIRADSKESGATWQENAALREAAFGNATEARRTAAAGLKLAPASQGVGVEAALAFAMARDTAQAESLAKDLNKRYPLDTQMQSLWLPAIHAQVALDRRDPAVALEGLQAAAPPWSWG